MIKISLAHTHPCFQEENVGCYLDSNRYPQENAYKTALFSGYYCTICGNRRAYKKARCEWCAPFISAFVNAGPADQDRAEEALLAHQDFWLNRTMPEKPEPQKPEINVNNQKLIENKENIKMENTSLVNFTTEGTEYPMDIIDQSGEKWITAKQVGEALGNTNIRKLINGLSENGEIKEDTHYRNLTLQNSGRGNPNMTVLSYRGVIRVAMRSEGKRAITFRDWAEDVLYEVMTTGNYSTGKKNYDLSDIKAMADAARMANATARSIGIRGKHNFINDVIREKTGIDIISKYNLTDDDFKSGKDIPKGKTKTGDTTDTAYLNSLISIWWRETGSASVKASVFYTIAEKHGIIPDNVMGKTRQARLVSFGTFVKNKIAGKIFTTDTGADVKLIKAGMKEGAKLWKIKEVEKEAEPKSKNLKMEGR